MMYTDQQPASMGIQTYPWISLTKRKRPFDDRLHCQCLVTRESSCSSKASTFTYWRFPVFDTVRLFTTSYKLRQSHRFKTQRTTDSTGEIGRQCSYCPSTAPKARTIIRQYPHSAQPILFIEAEASKLLNRSPLSVLRDNDKDEFINTIRSVLDQAGVDISKATITQAQVGRVDFKADLKLNEPISAYIVALAKCELARHTKHVINTETISFSNKTTCTIAYNKVACEQAKHGELANMTENILRLEFRLLNTSEMARQFGRKNVTLSDIFSEELSRSKLLHAFDALTQGFDAHSPSFTNDFQSIVSTLDKTGIKRNRGLTSLAALGLPLLLDKFGNNTYELARYMAAFGVYHKQQALRDLRTLRSINRSYDRQSTDLFNEIRDKLAIPLPDLEVKAS